MASPRIPTIFGRGPRERMLALLSVSEPLRINAIRRALGVRDSSIIRIVRHFEQCGIMRTGRRGTRRSYLTLGNNTALEKSILALGKRLATIGSIKPITGSHHRVGLRRQSRLRSRELEQLFVSGPRTRVLLLIAAAGEISVTELSRLLTLDEGATRKIVFCLERESIVVRRVDWREKPISLDPNGPVASELRSVLEAMLDKLPRYKALARNLRARTEIGIPDKSRYFRRGAPLTRASALLAILHPTHARALVAIASAGTIRMADLTKALRVEFPTARNVASSLVDAGLISEHPHRGRFIMESSFLLNPTHCCARELAVLLRAVCQSAGLQFRSTIPARTFYPRKGSWPPDHRGRARLALALHSGGPADVGTLARITRARRKQVVERIGLLRNARMIETTIVGRSVIAKIVGPPHVKDEMAALLEAMHRRGFEKNVLRLMFTRRPSAKR